MIDSDSSPSDFKKGWERNYFSELSEDDVSEVLENEWARDFLLMDYQEAGLDSRHRDRLLHNSFYVGLVLLGLIINGAITLYTSGEFSFVFLLLGIGGILYIVLGLWSLKAKGGRDASLDRRSEIEDLVKIVDSNLLRSNDSCFKRLTRIDDGIYKAEGLGRHEEISTGKLIVVIQFLIAIVLLFGSAHFS